MSRDARQVLIRPVLSEKSTRLGEVQNAHVFEVAPDATKVEIRQAFAVLFPKAKVRHVRTAVVKPKTTRHKFVLQGRHRGWKKAIVTLDRESRIELV